MHILLIFYRYHAFFVSLHILCSFIFTGGKKTDIIAQKNGINMLISGINRSDSDRRMVEPDKERLGSE